MLDRQKEGFRETDIEKARHRQMRRRWRADEVIEALRKERCEYDP